MNAPPMRSSSQGLWLPSSPQTETSGYALGTNPSSPVSHATPPPPSSLPPSSPPASSSPPGANAPAPSRRTPAPRTRGRKRRADDAPSDGQPADKYPAIRAQREEDVRREAAGKERRKMQGVSNEEWTWLRDEFTEIIEGRGSEILQSYEDGWDELWGVMEERDALEKQVKRQEKEISMLKARCEGLEERLRAQM